VLETVFIIIQNDSSIRKRLGNKIYFVERKYLIIV